MNNFSELKIYVISVLCLAPLLGLLGASLSTAIHRYDRESFESFLSSSLLNNILLTIIAMALIFIAAYTLMIFEIKKNNN